MTNRAASRTASRTASRIRAIRQSAAVLLGSSVLLGSPLQLTQAGRAQPAETTAPSEAAPTVRYARGEAVEFSEIVTEWRGYYEDVPVYLCVCQEATCNQTQQWPYREYQRYQLGLALGPTNGRVAEDSGANCFDIADNSRPNAPREYSVAQTSGTTGESAVPPPPPNAPETPESPTSNGSAVTAPVAPPTPTAPPTASTPDPPLTTTPSAAVSDEVPVATAIDNGAAVRLTWPSDVSNDIAIAGSTWSINVLDALDCASTSSVESKIMTAQRIVGEVAVDSKTGNVAIPVLLDSCVDTDQSAVFVVDPSEGGGYALYRTQLPGSRNFPDEFSSYSFSSLVDVRYWNGALYIQQGTASGAESVAIFRADRTPSGTYAGCGIVSAGEGANRLCPAP